MPAAVFVYADWSGRYPEFAGLVSSGQATGLFAEAGLFLDNTDASPVKDVPTRLILLWYVTAHLAQLNYGSSLKPKNAIVGRIDGATQGSVSFTTKYPDKIGSAAWFGQTNYGEAFWNATARYRAFSYRPGYAPARRHNPPW